MISRFAFIAILFISLNSCKDSKTETDTTSEAETESTTTDHKSPKVDMHTSEISLDWNGTYKGVLPCADCEGIDTELVINKDYTFVLKSIYLGKDEAVFETKGTFKWNDEGSEITTISENKDSRSYKVGENKLWHLDSDGNIITGDLAEHYILTKS